MSQVYLASYPAPACQNCSFYWSVYHVLDVVYHVLDASVIKLSAYIPNISTKPSLTPSVTSHICHTIKPYT